jgi:hypothetical protein
MEAYPNANELFTYHYKNKDDKWVERGRLVFDFDIEGDNMALVPDNFKEEVEEAIIETINRYYINVDVDKIVFVWSTSQNPKKYSKHLTIQNFYMTDWIEMGNVFYSNMTVVWESQERWIRASELFDKQIIRKNGGLRFVGCSKHGKDYRLVLDDEGHEISDSTIKIYDKETRRREQRICWKNHKVTDEPYRDLGIKPVGKIKARNSTRRNMINENSKTFDGDVYRTAIGFINNTHEGVFEPYKIDGSIISLRRLCPGECMLSGHVHENENAYITISEKIDPRSGSAKYFVYFGCYRGCLFNERKTKLIGIINVNVETVKPIESTKPSKSIKSKDTNEPTKKKKKIVSSSSRVRDIMKDF